MDESFRIEGWLREHFPRHPHIYFGLSGATLLCEALRTQQRTCVVMPAFICPSISFVAARAGKRLIHIDADPLTMHPRMDQLEKCLAAQDESQTVVLIDHSFGYPFPGVSNLKRRFPGVLFIEDCARALGTRINGHLPGEESDWVLLSMYKTVAGSLNGGILLTKTALPLRAGRRVGPTLRERASTVRPLRLVYDFVKRGRPEFEARGGPRWAPSWEPAYGLPSRLCMERFASELAWLICRSSLRRLIAQDLTASLSQIDGVECIKVAEGCESAGHFVSFHLPKREARDAILTGLHKKGLFLSRTWDLLPVHYQCFSRTFPMGHTGADQLAGRIAHIPVNLFFSSQKRQQLVNELHDLTFECAGQAA